MIESARRSISRARPLVAAGRRAIEGTRRALEGSRRALGGFRLLLMVPADARQPWAFGAVGRLLIGWRAAFTKLISDGGIVNFEW